MPTSVSGSDSASEYGVMQVVTGAEVGSTTVAGSSAPKKAGMSGSSYQHVPAKEAGEDL